jgi:hypothetical protein
MKKFALALSAAVLLAASPALANDPIESGFCYAGAPVMSFTETLDANFSTLGPLAVVPAAIAGAAGALNGWVVQPVDSAITGTPKTCADTVVKYGG